MSAIMISYNPFVVSRGIDGMPTSGSVTCVRTEFAAAKQLRRSGGSSTIVGFGKTLVYLGRGKLAVKTMPGMAQ